MKTQRLFSPNNLADHIAADLLARTRRFDLARVTGLPRRSVGPSSATSASLQPPSACSPTKRRAAGIEEDNLPKRGAWREPL
jgi:hypothetical protein